jgi:hypothetical protein
MNAKGENRIAVAAALMIVAVIILSLLAGCRTKTVVETVTIHHTDTVTAFRTDTVRDVKVTTKTDTIKQIESHTYTLNNVGDTVREIHHYHDLWHTLVVDSTDRYKDVVDSLRQALHEAKSKDKVVVKTKKVVRWWEYVVLLIIVGATIFFVLKRNAKT